MVTYRPHTSNDGDIMKVLLGQPLHLGFTRFNAIIVQFFNIVHTINHVPYDWPLYLCHVGLGCHPKGLHVKWYVDSLIYKCDTIYNNIKPYIRPNFHFKK